MPDLLVGAAPLDRHDALVGGRTSVPQDVTALVRDEVVRAGGVGAADEEPSVVRPAAKHSGRGSNVQCGVFAYFQSRAEGVLRLRNKIHGSGVQAESHASP